MKSYLGLIFFSLYCCCGSSYPSSSSIVKTHNQSSRLLLDLFLSKRSLLSSLICYSLTRKILSSPEFKNLPFTPTTAPGTSLHQPSSFPQPLFAHSSILQIPKPSYSLPNSSVNPIVWDTTCPSLDVYHKPLSIILKDPSAYFSKL